MAHTTHHRNFGIGHGAAAAVPVTTPQLSPRRADADFSAAELRRRADRRERALILAMLACGIVLALIGMLGLVGLVA